MKKINLLLLFSTIILSSSQCKKANNNPPNDQLPPITQTGANTFGCLINDNVWLPKGYDGNFLNSRITIDPSYADGDLTVRVYRIDNGIKVRMSLTSDSIKTIGIYPIKTISRTKFVLQKNNADNSINYCDVIQHTDGGPNPSNITGFIKITRYDLTNRIFSGEFEITFNNTNCGFGDPVRITQGRFDYRL